MAIPDYQTLSHVFITWMGQAAMRRHAGEIDRVNDGLLEAYNSYLDAHNQLLVQLIDQAQREFR
jgi:hypothetical protein